MNPDTNNQPAPQNNPQQPYGQYGGQPASAAYQQPAEQAQPQPGQYPQYNQQPQQQPNQPVVMPPADAQHHPNSTQNYLQIAEIRDGIAIMNDGSFRSVVMVKSINFDLMSPEERNAVEYAYQGFLNSLYFPVQMFIQSRRVDIKPYIKRLDKIRQEHANMLLALLMEDYIAYISDLASQTNIMDKKFYIVVPYYLTVDVQKAFSQSKNFFSGLTGLFKNEEVHVVINEKDMAKAKEELTKRVSAVINGLRECNIPALPLDTQELIELYYDAYNPDTATRQQLKHFDDVNAPIITKGQGQAARSDMQEGRQ